jgi:hypothetical protein
LLVSELPAVYRQLASESNRSGATTIGRGCPETPFLPGLQVTDCVRNESFVLDAHKEMFFWKTLAGTDLPR